MCLYGCKYYAIFRGTLEPGVGVSTKRSKQRPQKRQGRPRIGAPVADPAGRSLPSLPPAATQVDPPAPLIPGAPTSRREHGAYLPPDSKVRKTAMKILALRSTGLEDREIADLLGIKVRSVTAYVYRAGVNGWIKDAFNSGKEAIENQIVPKIIRNLDSLLDSTDEHLKAKVTLGAAEGTVFKQFEQHGGGPVAAPQMALQINIQQPTGAPLTVREGTIGGVASYGEVIDVEAE